MKFKVVFPREVLLVEVERWCGDPACGARARLSLTKAEARAYAGFECPRCELWNDDALSERDIPDWWEELKVASLEVPRPAATPGGGEGPGGALGRVSDAWKGPCETGGPEGGGESF